MNTMTCDQAVPLPPGAIDAAVDAFNAVKTGSPVICRPKLLAALDAAAAALRAQGAATERERIRKIAAEIASMCLGCDAFRAFFEDLDGTP